jgi:hypothetical protein
LDFLRVSSNLIAKTTTAGLLYTRKLYWTNINDIVSSYQGMQADPIQQQSRALLVARPTYYRFEQWLFYV